MTDCVTAAYKFAKRGIPIFPVAVDKRPLTRRGFHEATTDTAVLARWFSRWPEANIAIPTGKPSGIVVLDLDVAPDGHPAGAESLRVLEGTQSQQVPETLTVKTPRGGEHLYLKHPGGTVPCSAGKLGPGLDVRGDGGYVVVPPSVGEVGRYEYDNETRPAPMPEWLALLASGIAPGMRRFPTDPSMWVSILRDGFPEGERDHGIARLAGRYLALGLSAGEVRLLALWVNERSRPPLPAGDVERIVRSIAQRHLRAETERLRSAA